MINYVLGALIFSYAGLSLFKFMKKSKKGKCATCELNKSCRSNCHEMQQK
ncbi:FeoB-associated Cys-rich membrane protein [Ectobacillus sp. sgz5001026]